MSLDLSFRFNAIYILESLPTGEFRTGEELQDSLNELFSDGRPAPRVIYIRTPSRTELLSALATIATEVRTVGVGPLLHLEVHGLEDISGVALASGETITWSDIKPYLQSINVATGLHLFVMLSVCTGAGLVRAIDAGDQAPFWGMIGSDSSLPSSVLLAANREFYRVFFNKSDGAEAWRAMNVLTAGSDVQFSFYAAVHVFQLTFYSYVKQEGRPQAIAARASMLRMKWQLFGPPTQPPPFETLLGLHEMMFHKYYRQFFLIDLFPENRNRFPLLYERCRNDPGPLRFLAAV